LERKVYEFFVMLVSIIDITKRRHLVVMSLIIQKMNLNILE